MILAGKCGRTSNFWSMDVTFDFKYTLSEIVVTDRGLYKKKRKEKWKKLNLYSNIWEFCVWFLLLFCFCRSLVLNQSYNNYHNNRANHNNFDKTRHNFRLINLIFLTRILSLFFIYFSFIFFFFFWKALLNYLRLWLTACIYFPKSTRSNNINNN